MIDRLRSHYNLSTHHLYYLTLPVRYLLQGRTARAAGTNAYTLSYDKPKYMPFRHVKGDLHVRTSEEWGKRSQVIAIYVWSGWYWLRAYRAEDYADGPPAGGYELYLHIWAKRQEGHFG